MNLKIDFFQLLLKYCFGICSESGRMVAFTILILPIRDYLGLPGFVIFWNFFGECLTIFNAQVFLALIYFKKLFVAAIVNGMVLLILFRMLCIVIGRLLILCINSVCCYFVECIYQL